MKEEELNELVKEHYGFTIDEIDEDVGRLSLRVNQLEYNNKKIQQENKSLQSQLKVKEEVIKEAREYVENHSLYEEEYDYDYEDVMYLSNISDEQATKDLLKILSKGENK